MPFNLISFGFLSHALHKRLYIVICMPQARRRFHALRSQPLVAERSAESDAAHDPIYTGGLLDDAAAAYSGTPSQHRYMPAGGRDQDDQTTGIETTPPNTSGSGGDPVSPTLSPSPAPHKQDNRTLPARPRPVSMDGDQSNSSQRQRIEQGPPAAAAATGIPSVADAQAPGSGSNVGMHPAAHAEARSHAEKLGVADRLPPSEWANLQFQPAGMWLQQSNAAWQQQPSPGMYQMPTGMAAHPGSTPFHQPAPGIGLFQPTAQPGAPLARPPPTAAQTSQSRPPGAVAGASANLVPPGPLNANAQPFPGPSMMMQGPPSMMQMMQMNMQQQQQQMQQTMYLQQTIQQQHRQLVALQTHINESTVPSPAASFDEAATDTGPPARPEPVDSFVVADVVLPHGFDDIIMKHAGSIGDVDAIKKGIERRMKAITDYNDESGLTGFMESFAPAAAPTDDTHPLLDELTTISADESLMKAFKSATPPAGYPLQPTKVVTTRDETKAAPFNTRIAAAFIRFQAVVTMSFADQCAADVIFADTMEADTRASFATDLDQRLTGQPQELVTQLRDAAVAAFDQLITKKMSLKQLQKNRQAYTAKQEKEKKEQVEATAMKSAAAIDKSLDARINQVVEKKLSGNDNNKNDNSKNERSKKKKKKRAKSEGSCKDDAIEPDDDDDDDDGAGPAPRRRGAPKGRKHQRPQAAGQSESRQRGRNRDQGNRDRGRGRGGGGRGGGRGGTRGRNDSTRSRSRSRSRNIDIMQPSASAIDKNAAARQARRRSRRLSLRSGVLPDVGSWTEALRIPGMLLKLPLLMLCGMFIATVPVVCLDNPVLNVAFRDLSGIPLTAAAKHVCGLGLGFAPTPSFSEARIRSDLKTAVKTFQRSVILTDYFGTCNHWDDSDGRADALSVADPAMEPYLPCPAQCRIPNLAWMPSGFNPSTGVLEYCMDLGERAANIVFPTQRTASNLCHRFRSALGKMTTTTEHIFTISDKNLGLVTMGREQYETACLESLATTHVEVDTTAADVISSTLVKLRTLLTDHVIDQDLPEWLEKWCVAAAKAHPVTNKPYSLAAFRVMPKQHKDPLEYRQLQGNHTWATQPYALVVAVMFMTIKRRLSTFIHDSDDFIRRISALVLPTGALLCQIDVMKLYSSIIHDHCIFTVRAYLIEEGFPMVELAIAIITLVLAENYCIFNGRIFKQVVGFATGVAFGAEVADIYLHAVERRNLRLHVHSLALFVRFIDDGFGVWLGTAATLHVLLDTLYDGTGLNITRAASTSNAIMLDMLVFRQAY